MKSQAKIVLVGDHRQATYTTNDSRKNKKFARANVVEKFKQWEKDGLCAIDYQTDTTVVFRKSAIF